MSITGVEIAAGDSSSIDLALAHGGQLVPTLARSVDGGATWALIDLGAVLGTDQIRIAAIDPADPDRVFLRGIGVSGDVLAVFDGASPPVQVVLAFGNGQMTAFVKTTSGTVLVAGNSSSVPQLFRSQDERDYEPLAGAPAILSMAERQGAIYAATDTTVHPFGEALSGDEGVTWTPGLRFAEIDAIAGCLAAACQDDCHMRAAQQQWPAAMCAAAPPADPLADAGPPPLLADASVPRPDASVPPTRRRPRRSSTRPPAATRRAPRRRPTPAPSRSPATPARTSTSPPRWSAAHARCPPAQPQASSSRSSR